MALTARSAIERQSPLFGLAQNGPRRKNTNIAINISATITTPAPPILAHNRWSAAAQTQKDIPMPNPTPRP